MSQTAERAYATIHTSDAKVYEVLATNTGFVAHEGSAGPWSAKGPAASVDESFRAAIRAIERHRKEQSV
jgi:hypothetical protein